MTIYDADKKLGEIKEWMRADQELLTKVTAQISLVAQRPTDFTTKGERDTGFIRIRDIEERQREAYLAVRRIVTEMEYILDILPRVKENINRGYIEVDIITRNDDEDADRDDDDYEDEDREDDDDGGDDE